MDGMVREVNARKGEFTKQVNATCLVNGGMFELNQQMFADDTALADDSEEKLCRLVKRIW